MGKLGGRNTKSYLLFLVLVFFVIGCTPLFSNVYLYIILWVLFLPSLFYILHIEINRHPVLLICLLLFIFQNVLYRVIGISSASWGRYPGYLLSFAPFFLMLPISHSVSNKHKTFLFWFVVVLMVFNICDSIRLSLLYPFLDVDSMREYKDFVSTINLGGTPFFNCTLFFSSICFVVFLNNKRKMVKYSMLSCVLLSAIYIIYFTNKASVVVYFVLSILLIAYAKFTKKRNYFYMVLLFTFCVLVPIVEMYEDIIIDFIIYISPSQRLSSRLVALVNINEMEADSSSFTARENLWLVSLKTWFSSIPNFIMGIGDHYVTGNSEKTGIGQHSDLLDSFARYGLIGLILIYYILKNSFKLVSSMFDEKLKLQVYTIVIIYLLCGFTKKIFITGMGCIVFLFLPIALIYLSRSNKINLIQK